MSPRELSKEFNISKSILHQHIAAATKETQLKEKERTAVFSSDEILELKTVFLIWLNLDLLQHCLTYVKLSLIMLIRIII